MHGEPTYILATELQIRVIKINTPPQTSPKKLMNTLNLEIAKKFKSNYGITFQIIARATQMCRLLRFVNKFHSHP